MQSKYKQAAAVARAAVKVWGYWRQSCRNYGAKRPASRARFARQIKRRYRVMVRYHLQHGCLPYCYRHYYAQVPQTPAVQASIAVLNSFNRAWRLNPAQLALHTYSMDGPPNTGAPIQYSAAQYPHLYRAFAGFMPLRQVWAAMPPTITAPPAFTAADLAGLNTALGTLTGAQWLLFYNTPPLQQPSFALAAASGLLQLQLKALGMRPTYGHGI